MRQQLFVLLVAAAFFALVPRAVFASETSGSEESEKATASATGSEESKKATTSATATKRAKSTKTASATKNAKPKKTASASKGSKASKKPSQKKAAKPKKSAKISKSAKRSDPNAPLRLPLKNAPDAYYYTPTVRGQRPIIMYLHGRGGNPAADCRKWARVARQFGWVACPSAPVSHSSGGRTWATGTGDARRIINATVEALREKYGRRVQLWGNVLVGFSEGAWVAMNVGLLDQRTWNRWLILGASDAYWGDVSEALARKKRKIKRVYLLTGERDGVAQNTLRVGETLKKQKVPVRVRLVPGLGHEVPSDRMISTYRRPLAWLVAAP